MSMHSTDTINWPRSQDDDSTSTGSRRESVGTTSAGAARVAVPAVSVGVLLGSGVLAAWIIAIYLGLAFFKRLARSERSEAATTDRAATRSSTYGDNQKVVSRSARAQQHSGMNHRGWNERPA